MATKERFFDDYGDKTNDKQGKNNAERYANTSTDTEKIFICHGIYRTLHACQRLIRRPLSRRYTVIQSDAAIRVAGQDQPRMRFE